MIIFNILQSDEATAHKMSDYLIEQKYALQTHVDTNIVLDGKNKKQTIRLFFITRSLLFDTIEKDIFEKFPSAELVMYADPVSHFSAEFGARLREGLRTVETVEVR